MILNGFPWKQIKIILSFEIAPKYCILDFFVDYEGYSISSKRFLPTVLMSYFQIFYPFSIYVCMWCVSQGSKFIGLLVDTHLLQHHLLKRLLFPQQIFSALCSGDQLTINVRAYLWTLSYIPLIPIISTCQYHLVLIIVAFVASSEIGKCVSSNSVLLFQDCLGTLPYKG